MAAPLRDDPGACSVTFGAGLCHSGKYRYDTSSAAYRGQRAMRRKHHEKLGVYRCPNCHGWHLGHQRTR